MKKKKNSDKFYSSKKLILQKFESATFRTIFSLVVLVLVSAVIYLSIQVFNRRTEVKIVTPSEAQPFNPGLQLYVDLNGNDANNGRSSSSAYKTISRAKNEIRTIRNSQGIPNGGIAVNIAEGTYEDTSLSFDTSDNGTNTSPVVYRGVGNKVRLLGAKKIPVSSLSGGTIKQVDLKNHGISSIKDFGGRTSGYDGSAPMELYFDNKRMTIAQYPNSPNWAYTTGSISVPAAGYATYKCGDSSYDCSVIDSFAGVSGLQVHLWNFDYASLFSTASIDKSSKRINLLGSWLETYGEKPFRLVNARNLIDTAGEYYIDPNTTILYFYPPTGLANQEMYVSSQDSVIKLNNTSDVRFERFTMEMAYGNLIDITKGNNVQILGNKLRNSGKNAVAVLGGSNHLIQSNDMYDLGEGGVLVKEDPLTKQDSSNISVLNNHIYKFEQVQMTYRQAISFKGLGNRAAYNKIHDAPNMATWIQGSNNILEYNEIFDVVKESGDTAPFHTAFSAGTQGNEVRYNYIHDIDPNNYRLSRGVIQCEGTTGVYLDDSTSNFRVYGNIIYKPGVRGVFVNNGNNNKIENNIFIGSQYGVYLQHRYWTIPEPPKGNVIQNNVNYNVEVPLTPPNKSAECPNASYQDNMFRDNTISNSNGGVKLTSDPGIIDPNTKQLKAGTSQVITAALPQFQKIPVECIGNYNDEYRSDANRNGTCGQSVPAPTQPPSANSPTPVTQTAVPQTAPPAVGNSSGKLIVIAAGSVLPGTSMPIFEVRYKDSLIASQLVTGQLVNYSFNVPSNAQVQDIKIVYTNDISTNTTNRDLRVDSVTLNNVTYSSTADDTYSTGTWTASDNCAPGYKNSVWLHCNGYFQYKATAAAATPTAIPTAVPTKSPTPLPTSTPTAVPTPVATVATNITPKPTFSAAPIPTDAPPQPQQTAGTNQSEITIYAAGQPAKGIWPKLGITVIGEQTGDIVNIITRDVRAYTYTPRNNAQVKQLQFNFINDYYEQQKDIYGNVTRSIDRNLRIQKVVQNGTTYNTTDDDTYSQGSWTASNGCSSTGFLRAEWLHCQWGYFRFDQR
jgi:parallel beta-helix repeat protein